MQKRKLARALDDRFIGLCFLVYRLYCRGFGFCDNRQRAYGRTNGGRTQKDTSKGRKLIVQICNCLAPAQPCQIAMG